MLDLITLRLAAAGGSINAHSAGSLVAGGFTMLQRCAPLVRALAGKRGALILPPSAMAVTALAACDGRGAVLFTPAEATALGSDALEAKLQAANVGAVFTSIDAVRALAGSPVTSPDTPPAEGCPIPVVLMDDVPAAAEWVPTDGPRKRIDLGAHFGLDIAGTLDDPLRNEPFVHFYRRGALETLTHRETIERARALETDTEIPRMVREMILPLLAGKTLECSPRATA